MTLPLSGLVPPFAHATVPEVPFFAIVQGTQGTQAGMFDRLPQPATLAYRPAYDQGLEFVPQDTSLCHRTSWEERMEALCKKRVGYVVERSFPPRYGNSTLKNPLHARPCTSLPVPWRILRTATPNMGVHGMKPIPWLHQAHRCEAATRPANLHDPGGTPG